MLEGQLFSPTLLLGNSFSCKIFSLQVKNRKDKHHNKNQTATEEFARLYVVKCTFQSSREERYPGLSALNQIQIKDAISWAVCRLTVFNSATDIWKSAVPPNNCTNKKSQSSKRVRETYHRVCKFPNGTGQLRRSAHLSNDCGIFGRKYGRPNTGRRLLQRILGLLTPCRCMRVVTF